VAACDEEVVEGMQLGAAVNAVVVEEKNKDRP
jgi:hypothetical protein